MQKPWVQSENCRALTLENGSIKLELALRDIVKLGVTQAKTGKNMEKFDLAWAEENLVDFEVILRLLLDKEDFLGWAKMLPSTRIFWWWNGGWPCNIKDHLF